MPVDKDLQDAASMWAFAETGNLVRSLTFIQAYMRGAETRFDVTQGKLRTS